MQRADAATAPDVPLLSVTGSALWITSSTLQGDDGSALALSLVEDAQVRVSGSTIQGWRSGVAPVAVVGQNCSLSLEDCDVTDNTNTSFLPAVYASSEATGPVSAVVLRGSRLARNAEPFLGTWLAGGAAFFSDDGALRVLRVKENATVPVLPLGASAAAATAAVLTAWDDPLLSGSGDITSTDDSASDLTGEVPAPRGGFFFGPAQATGSEAPPEDGTDEDGTATDGTGVPPADDTVAVPASAPAVVPDSAALSGTVSISTDSRNPGLVSEATTAEVQPEEGDFDNSLTTALLATFAVLASSIVALIAVVAVLTELRRRRKKEWLRESVDDHVATSASIPGELSLDHTVTLGLPPSTRTPGERCSGEHVAPWSLSRLMLVANAAFDPQLSARRGSAARYAHDADTAASAPAAGPADGDGDGDTWEGGYGAHDGRTDFLNPLTGRASSGAQGAPAGHTLLDESEYDSDSSSLDFDMRGINAFREISTELAR